jgi:hypothetical protein
MATQLTPEKRDLAFTLLDNGDYTFATKQNDKLQKITFPNGLYLFRDRTSQDTWRDSVVGSQVDTKLDALCTKLAETALLDAETDTYANAVLANFDAVW